MIETGNISLTPADTLPHTTPTPAYKAVYGWVLAALLTVLTGWLLTYLPMITTEGAIAASIPWVPDLGLSISLYLDGLALLFGVVILGIGALILIYAGYYFTDTRELTRFYGLLLGFMGAMLALVFSGNILTLFIAWELTSILSFLLIGFNGQQEAARKGALQALMITGAGGLALLVGLVLLGTAAGSSEFSQILSSEALREHPWYTGFTVLILLGCFTKSAQFPFHFWLPGAMSAPTPASAYLHSATMVKAGVYLLLRLSPVLGDTNFWQTVLMSVGLLTLLMGTVFALRQRDLKAALAYLTISQLGALVMLISLPHEAGIEAALVSILAHALYKAALFLTVGAIDHATGTRDLTKLGGLLQTMPGWALVAAVATLSMAGVPPLLGFVAKESVLAVLLDNPLALAIVVISAALTVAMSGMLFADVFLGHRKQHHDHDHHDHENPRGLIFAPAVMVGGSAAAGLLLPLLVAPLLTPAVPHELHLTLFAGFNTPFLLSMIALAAGGAIFATRNSWRSLPALPLPQGTVVYQQLVRGVEKAGDLLLLTQGGKLRYYLVVILGAVIALQASAGLDHLDLGRMELRFNGAVDVLRGLLLLLAMGATLASILTRKHLIAALALGLSGYCVGGLFLLEPAPDVALVQFMVETVGAVLLIVMLARIRTDEREQAMTSLWNQTKPGMLRDALIAALIGGGVGLFALAAINHRPTPETIATWHLENSVTETGINDVVGAIVTDFRGMDTLIEISVFSVAALGVLTILARPGKASQQPEATIHEAQADDDLPPVPKFSTPLTRTIALLVLPFAFLVALTQLLYGGDAPGDGFTAGVITGLGVALWYVVFGYPESHERLRWLNPRLLIGIGLTLAIANAVFPLLIGDSFLAHLAFDQLHLPANLHLSSSLVYETGIFLTVLGSISMIMEAIAYPKEVEAL